jgi:hypothetical protein
MEFSKKGAGFSPYINLAHGCAGLAAEGMQIVARNEPSGAKQAAKKRVEVVRICKTRSAGAKARVTLLAFSA